MVPCNDIGSIAATNDVIGKSSCFRQERVWNQSWFYSINTVDEHDIDCKQANELPTSCCVISQSVAEGIA